ncbi:MAG: hypothetical protein HUK08_03650 [Bacteroidaceae bacterium]|nr:hypothetical protein [Bacteroidaceae bacterium]
METTSKPAGRSLQYYSREIHRVLGYLTLGMVIVYALSGILLIHRTGDFMKHTAAVEQTLKPGLDADQLAAAMKMKTLKVQKETDQTIFFADGQYDKTSGKASYLKKEVVAPFDKFITLHKLADKQNHVVAVFTTIFGVSLFLLALTSLFMFKTKARQFKTNMAYTCIGAVLIVLLLMFA